MASTSRWRNHYAPIIATCLAGLPAEASRQACEKALRPLYPSGAREHHPYRMWRAEVRMQLDKRLGAVSRSKGSDVILCAEGVHCKLCARSRRSSCILCGPARDRWNALLASERETFRATMLERRETDDVDGIAEDWSQEFMDGLPLGDKKA